MHTHTHTHTHTLTGGNIIIASSPKPIWITPYIALILVGRGERLGGGGEGGNTYTMYTQKSLYRNQNAHWRSQPEQTHDYTPPPAAETNSSTREINPHTPYPLKPRRHTFHHNIDTSPWQQLRAHTLDIWRTVITVWNWRPDCLVLNTISRADIWELKTRHRLVWIRLTFDRQEIVNDSISFIQKGHHSKYNTAKSMEQHVRKNQTDRQKTNKQTTTKRPPTTKNSTQSV